MKKMSKIMGNKSGEWLPQLLTKKSLTHLPLFWPFFTRLTAIFGRLKPLRPLPKQDRPYLSICPFVPRQKRSIVDAW